jgi:2-amino-4-hydroxy-6-hydroxymethyldihydropteridine diphosphokinase
MGDGGLRKNTAYIGFGSNLGAKLENCRDAIRRMEQIAGCHVASQSSFYRTEPVGVSGQDWYLNGVLDLETDLSPRELLHALLDIETAMGRIRRKRWDSRIIDLDILLYEREVVDEDDLKVPHPLLHLRRFVLVPMVQLAPDLMHPVLKKPMRQLLQNLSDEGQSVVLFREDTCAC